MWMQSRGHSPTSLCVYIKYLYICMYVCLCVHEYIKCSGHAKLPTECCLVYFVFVCIYYYIYTCDDMPHCGAVWMILFI